MAASKRVPVYCWISIVLMSLAISIDGTEDDGHQLYNYDSIFENIHGDITYDFVEESMSWAEAQKSCEDRRGHLLRDLNDEVKEFLQTLSTGPGRWWVNQDSMSGDSMGGSDVNYPRHLVCTYLETEPFRLVTTPNCSMSFGSLCTLDANTHLKSSEAKHRHRRSTVGEMTSISTIAPLLETAKLILKNMETTVEVMTKDDRVLYLKQIYRIVKLLPVTADMAPAVLNITSAMLLYTQECELDNFDDFEELIINAGLIYATVKNGPFTQEMPTGTMFVDSKTPEQLGGTEVGSKNGTYCQLPSLSALSGQLPPGSVNVQLFQFKVNPMQDKSNESITGTTCSFSLQKEDSAIKLIGLPENIEIFLPRPGAGEPEVVSIDWKSGYSVTSSFNITDANMTVIVTARPNKNVTLSFQLFPSESNRTNQNATASAYRGLKEDYRWLITPEMRKGGHIGWKVAILPINYTSSDQLTLKVSVFVTKCLFWDTDLAQWSREGCMVGPKTIPSLTHCLCNHTTFFGSSFFVMPNQVDLSQTAALFATVNENYIVVVLLSCFLAVFLVVLAWAWYADRKALRTRKMTLLDDSHPCAEYNYLVTIQTGHRRHAGTTAKVRAILYFEEGNSETYNLSDPEKPVFERGGVDVFVLSIPFSLGTVESIEIWHDNSSGDPDWYLNRLTVQDLQTQEVTHFLCSTWLRGETCKRTFNSAKNNEIASFGDIFQTRTSSGFRDEHIWVSVVDPPRRSPFTRVQRVACCMSLLLCTMAINIMFWNLPTDEESPVLLKIGSFALTWQELMVAVESGLFMFPINILIITIFRHIKPRVVANKEESDIIKNKAVIPASVSMNTIIQEIMDLLACLSKSPKNMLGKDVRSESSGDLFWALNKVHDLIETMTAEMVGDPHWSYCSRFVFYSLSHVSRLLDHVGEKGCFLNEELRQARGTLSVLLKKAELASLRHAAQTTVIVQQPQKKKGWWLPWWFLFVGWALLFFMSGISTFFTLLYGFQYGRESSIQWVITLTLSLVQSIFILQPLKVILVAIFFAMILRPVAVDDNEEVELLLKEQKKRCEEYSGRSTS
ncbi:polycystic kidney disease protein 1-like 2 [Triplophysa rosa]|uniref:Polycystic kidney disease protein 1-like 2 n=1 Tax=Triplophysa rosa TaxID=992332 RepID=A0A9W7X5Z6_TRIRA|nr:polycystic kidney disease protein 1-like 2 [Triplophysa rosa]KAI7814355.1 putative polycystic kidney disease protein 1-like 2 [Triplophysa rosa]